MKPEPEGGPHGGWSLALILRWIGMAIVAILTLALLADPQTRESGGPIMISIAVLLGACIIAFTIDERAA